MLIIEAERVAWDHWGSRFSADRIRNTCKKGQGEMKKHKTMEERSQVSDLTFR